MASLPAVWHGDPGLHLGLDAVGAESTWFFGENQVDYVASTGMVMTC